MLDDFQIPKIREYEDIVISPVRAGIYDYDKGYYMHALEKSKFPTLVNPYVLYDGEKTLDPGHYEIALSQDKKFLFFIQSTELKAVVPTIKIVQKNSKEYQKRMNEIEEEKAKLKKKNKSMKKLDDELQNITQLEMNAKITDSKNGYYIVEYKKFNTYAWGYIPY